jgi:predicted homoserine dehydrogenase-like protein
MQALIHPAQSLDANAPIPLHIASGNKLIKDVPAGTLLTVDMVEEPVQSVLWDLRRQQDRAK